MNVRIVGVVIDIVDGDVVDRCVADVHPVHVFTAGVIRGNIHLPGTKRKPCDIARASAAHGN